MQETREQKKHRMMQAADAVIETMLDWDAAHATPNLTEIEDEVLSLRRAFGQALMGIVVSDQAAVQPPTGAPCPHCGTEARYKGQKPKMVESRAGGLEVVRGYYYCPRCKSGFFPPRPATGAGE